MKFSIITPSYNRADLISGAIESVMKQKYADWELIIVDDGSTDNTKEVISSYSYDSRIKYIDKHNSGAAHSRNIGAENAVGDFITFLDSDDQVYQDWLLKVKEKITADTGVVCVGAIRKLYTGETIKEKLVKTDIFGEYVKFKFTAGSLFIKRNLFHEIGGYDITLPSNHHTDLGYRLLLYLKQTKYKVLSLDDFLVQINIHEGLRIRNNWHKVHEGTLSFIKKHYVFLSASHVKGLSNSYGVVAYANYKLERKRAALFYQLKAIKYRPYKLKSYLKLIKYALI